MAQAQQNEARKGYPISRIKNDCKLSDIELTLRCVEFTWNCDLKSHAPDFGIVEVKYVPLEFIAETKAFKYYLTTYRYRDCFAEELCQRILLDFLYYIKPFKVEVTLKQNRRGGIINIVTMRWDSINEIDFAGWNALKYTPKHNFRGGFSLLKDEL